MPSIAERLRHEKRITGAAQALVSLGAGPRRLINRRSREERMRWIREREVAARERCKALGGRSRSAEEESEFNSLLVAHPKWSREYFERRTWIETERRIAEVRAIRG